MSTLDLQPDQTGPRPGPVDPGDPAEPTRAATRRFRVGVGLIMLVGFGVRLAFILIRQSKAPLKGGDAYWYHFQAKLVAQGKGFLHPFEYYMNGRSVTGADHPPGMTVILAVADRVGLASPQAQRILMAVLGTVTIAVVAHVGRRIGGPAVGLVAAALTALYPNVWINDGMLMAETPFVLGIAVMLLCTYRLIERPRWGDVLGLSAGVTLAALTRPEAVLLFPFLVLPLVATRRSLPVGRRVVLLGLAAVIPVAAFGPWLLYNRSRFEAPVAISTGAGQSLVVANCDLTYGGRNLGYWDRRCLLPPRMETPAEPDLSLRDGIYQQRARRYIRDNISQVPQVVLARVGRLWGVFRIDESIVDDAFIEGRAGGVPGTGFGLVREALWSYFVLMALAIPGLVLLRRRRVPVWPLLAAPALATFAAVLTFGITRYRAGAELSIVLLAAVSLVAVARALSGRSQSGTDAGSDNGTGPAAGAAASGAAASSSRSIDARNRATSSASTRDRSSSRDSSHEKCTTTRNRKATAAKRMVAGG